MIIKKERNERRRVKMLNLIEDTCGGVNSVFANKIGKDPSYINRTLYPEGKAGKKNIGEEIMDAVIDAYNFPENWWYIDHQTDIVDLNYATIDKLEHIKKVVEMSADDFRETDEIFEAASEIIKNRKSKKDE